MKLCTRHQALHLIKPYLPDKPVLIEAGAYKGQDSLYMAKLFPTATLHLFEPVPELFALLKQNTSQSPRLHYWHYALSDTIGVTPFYVAEKKEDPGVPTQAGSLLPPKERLLKSSIVYPRHIQVPTITLDQWTKENNISKIDFLWLDAQGNELAILNGARTILPKVTALLVELHFIQAYEGQPLADEIISWLDNHDFVMIAKDYADQPAWFFGNGLFIKKNLL